MGCADLLILLIPLGLLVVAFSGLISRYGMDMTCSRHARILLEMAVMMSHKSSKIGLFFMNF